MKIYIFYLIVLGMISSVDGILCVHIGDGLIQSYVPSSWIDDFKDYIWNNYQLIESEICCIRIPMIYEPTFMQIYFTNRTYCSQTDDGYVMLNTFVELYKHYPLQANILSYSCSTDDYCEIDFLMKHLHWLVNDGLQKTFVEQTIPFLIGTIIDYDKDCYDSEFENFTNGCLPWDVCTISLIDNELKQGCLGSLPLGILIQTQVNLSNFQESQSISFGCDFNQCNSEENFHELKSLIDRYYDLTSFRNTLYNNQSKPSHLTSTTSTQSSFRRITIDPIISAATHPLFMISHCYFLVFLFFQSHI